MITLHSYDGLVSILNRACPDKTNRCLVALLFADPGFSLVKDEIFPFLGRFNVRSGRLTHFFFTGYLLESQILRYKDSELAIQGPNKREWYFSATAFDEFRRDLERRTKWKYSGGVDFLLLDAVRETALDSNNHGLLTLQFNQVVSFDLIDAREAKRIPVLSKFFEEVFRYSENKLEDATTTRFSDTKLFPLCVSVAEGALKTLVPGYVVDGFKNAKQFAIQDLSY